MFTQRWQDHQRELDVQTELVSQITKASTQFLVASRLAVFDHSSSSVRRLTAAWRRWRTDSAVIRAKLCAYYHEDLVRQRESFDRAVVGFYNLAGSTPKLGLDMIQSELHVRIPTGDYGPACEAGSPSLVLANERRHAT
jgi:hypothetical protein